MLLNRMSTDLRACFYVAANLTKSVCVKFSLFSQRFFSLFSR